MYLALNWEKAKGALPMEAVFEVVKKETIERIPRSRECVRGIIVRRGYSIPVFDLAKLPGFFSRSADAGIKNKTAEEHIVIIQTGEGIDGILVESVGILAEYEEKAGARADVGISEEFVESTLAEDNIAYGLVSLSRLLDKMHFMVY